MNTYLLSLKYLYERWKDFEFQQVQNLWRSHLVSRLLLLRLFHVTTHVHIYRSSSMANQVTRRPLSKHYVILILQILDALHLYQYPVLFVCLLLARQPPVSQGLLILEVSRSHTTTLHSWWDSSGRVISSLQRPLPDNTQHSQQDPHTSMYIL